MAIASSKYQSFRTQDCSCSWATTSQHDEQDEEEELPSEAEDGWDEAVMAWKEDDLFGLYSTLPDQYRSRPPDRTRKVNTTPLSLSLSWRLQVGSAGLLGLPGEGAGQGRGSTGGRLGSGGGLRRTESQCRADWLLELMTRGGELEEGRGSLSPAPTPPRRSLSPTQPRISPAHSPGRVRQGSTAPAPPRYQNLPTITVCQEEPPQNTSL